MNTIRLGLVGAVLVALGLAGYATATPAFAATTITDCPTTEAALQNDITTAGPGGTVAFNCASATTIPFDAAHGGMGAITIAQDVTLDASKATGRVAFSGGRSTRLFSVNSGHALSLIHLTLQDGSATAGGVLTIGGAIYNVGTLSITESTLSGNAATNYGGAIDNEGTLSITESTLSGNSAFYGGAILNDGSVSITNSTLSGNSVGASGGAIDNGATMRITGSTFSSNTAGSSGGAITNQAGATLDISASTFSANSMSVG